MEPLSSAAIAISSIIATKAFEKVGENLGESFADRLDKFISLIKKKKLFKTQAIEEKLSTSNYEGAVQELEVATKFDSELDTVVTALVQAVESDPSLLEKVRNTAVLVKERPSIIQNQAKLAEKIGLVVQGGEVNIENFNV